MEKKEIKKSLAYYNILCLLVLLTFDKLKAFAYTDEIKCVKFE